MSPYVDHKANARAISAVKSKFKNEDPSTDLVDPPVNALVEFPLPAILQVTTPPASPVVLGVSPQLVPVRFGIPRPSSATV
jgi:hypothetical protein